MPASYAFSIWGLIYILLGVFTVYQAQLTKLTPGKVLIYEKINWWFVINLTLNPTWLVIY